MDQSFKTIDCACVIHGDGYSWQYVDRLYNMLVRNLTPAVRLHVYTESTRIVPAPYVKHSLTDWSISGPKKAWWYKLQLFNPAHHAGSLLYFDLDTVIVGNIDWMWKSNTKNFWAIRDFRYLWRTNSMGINSSAMYWDTTKYSFIWDHFSNANFKSISNQYRGDQDYLTYIIPDNQRRLFDTNRIKSWRWECLDGGYDFQKKCHFTPGTGTNFPPETSVLIFHGSPKPNEIQDTIVLEHWK